MATASPTRVQARAPVRTQVRAPSRSLASPAIRALVGRRMADLVALAVAMGAIALLVALATYNPRDPSLNTATSQHATNLAGPGGAIVADFLLQGFGAASILPGAAMLAWAWRIASRRGLGMAWMRIGTTALAVPALATALAVAGPHLSWPTGAGLGGAGGHLLSVTLLDMARAPLGRLGALLVFLGAIVLAAGLCAASFGLTLRDWRTASRGAAVAARAGASGGQFVAGLVQRTTARAAPSAATPGKVSEPSLAAPARQQPAYRQAAPAAPGLQEAAPEPTVRKATLRARVAMPDRRPPAPRQESLPLQEAGWRFPPNSLLVTAPSRTAAGSPSEESLQNNARLLESVLADYGVQGAIRDIRPGPVVTLYELEPAPGIRSARVIGLADDVARSLSVTAVRIATVPGRNVIGIEVPNQKRETVYLNEMLESEDWTRHQGRLPLALGKDISGAPVISDLARMPHLLIAGTTGSGKSVGINAMILSLLFKLSPDQCRMILIDPKMLELSVYEGIPPPDGAGGDRAGQGGERAEMDGTRDGAPLPRHEPARRAQRRRL